MENKKKKYKLETIEILIIFISICLLIFAFFAPGLFVNNITNGFDFTESGQIGDTIGGMMNLFIALAGVLITFLAFYIQFKANKEQKELFRQELDSNKFESQFYEMLRLHKIEVLTEYREVSNHQIASDLLTFRNHEV